MMAQGPAVAAGLRLRLRNWVRRRPLVYTLVKFMKYGPDRGLSVGRARQDLLDRAAREGWRVLYLGSGGRRQPGMVNVDITPVTGPDIVADGYRLPFAAASFDAIFCEYVIEHVPDPERFLEAATAVLKPGGVWYLKVPFLQPWHGGADFQRWTVEGFRAALSRARLEPVQDGVDMGPGFFLMWYLREVLGLLLSAGWQPLRRFWNWLFGFILSPLVLADLVLARLPGAAELACGHWHVARRPATPDGDAA